MILIPKKNIAFYLEHLLISFLFISSPTVHAQPIIEWLARYSASGTTGTGKNYIALDKLGNCYVFGVRGIPGNNSDYLTIKYKPNGDTAWVRTYNNQPNSHEENSGIACDSIGNVYITGYSGYNLGPWDIVTIKYNPQGVQLWAKVYSGASNLSDISRDIKLDWQGNIYVAGTSGTTTLVIKYNSNGDSVWVRRYNQTGYTSSAVSVAVDNQYNVYVGGGTNNSSTNETSYLTLKYDSNGNLQWHAEYLHLGFELPTKVAVDNSGNCFITGSSYDPSSNDDYLTVKYNSLGVQQWVRRYNGLANNIDQPFDISVDINGNILVTGASGGTDLDYTTIKYNTNGDSLWVRRYNGPGNYNDEAYSLALDDSGNAYVTGRSTGTNSNWDYATIKYYSNGNTAWVERYTGISGSGGIGYGVAIDGNRNVYVTGISDSASLAGYVTIKYSQLVGLIPIISETPSEFKLEQNFPNPFNPITVINYELRVTSYVKLGIYDLTGRHILDLVKQKQNAGAYSFNFSGIGLASGIYFYTLFADEKLIDTKKMILIK